VKHAAYSSSLELMTTGDGAWIGTPPAVARGALKAAALSSGWTAAGAALDPPLWTVVPNKALSLPLSLSLCRHPETPPRHQGGAPPYGRASPQVLN
jgi:hypothetical protein